MKTTKGIRAKRFQVKKDSAVFLMIETETGEKGKFSVRNCSLSGIAVWAEGSLLSLVPKDPGHIIPESKLVWGESEVSLGRLVFRSRVQLVEGSGGASIGFSCVDTKVPLMGSLSSFLDASIDSEEGALVFELGEKKFSLASFMEGDYTNVDLFHKCREYTLLDSTLSKNPFYQYYSIRHETNGTHIKISRPQNPKPTDYINFSGYDYFGLSGDPRVKESAIKAIERYGVSATASPPLGGNTKLHEELEFNIAKLLRKEAAMVFGTGFSANVGTLTAILGPNDLAVADILSHASLHDGLSASKAKVRLFRHNNNEHFEALLAEHRPAHAGTLVVTEGLFSMDGDCPDLKQFVKVAKAQRARIFLDEVHSFGIFGPSGLGAAERYGVLDDVDIFMGCFNKGFGAGSGFVAGSRDLIRWLRAFARSSMFSSAVPATCVGAALKALEINQSEPERRLRLLENIKKFRQGLQDLGYSPVSDPESPIIPVIVGDQQKLGIMNQVMLDFGVFVTPIVFPAVPITSSRFRYSISSTHSHSDIQLALMALKRAIEVGEIDLSKKEDRVQAA